MAYITKIQDTAGTEHAIPAVSSGGGAGEVLRKSSAADYDYGWKAADGVKRMDLLWTNSSPSSSFPAQTITVANLDKYDSFYVKFIGLQSGSNYFEDGDVFVNSYMLDLGRTCVAHSFARSSHPEADMWLASVSKGFKIDKTANSVYFYDASIVYTKDYGLTIRNDVSIPYKIYGIVEWDTDIS